MIAANYQSFGMLSRMFRKVLRFDRRYRSEEKSLENNPEKKDKSVDKKKQKAVTPVLDMKRTDPPPPTMAKVTLLAADQLMAHVAALSLKLQSDYVGEVRLWDEAGSLRGVGLEMALIPTSTRISSFVGEGQIQAALRGAEIVVVMGRSWGLPNEASSDLFYKNADRVRELAKTIIASAPRAMIGIAVPPITTNVAFFGEIQREQGAFCPNRLFGILSLEEMRMKSVVASRLGIPPGVLSVKLTGGGTPLSLVPVISQVKPGGECLKAEVLEMTALIRGMTEKIKDSREGKGPDISAGFGVANFVRAVAKGLYSGKNPVINAVVRTSCIHGIPYLALPVKLGPSGIVSTQGIPRLTDEELRLLIKALPIITEDIVTGETWAHASKQAALAAQ